MASRRRKAAAEKLRLKSPTRRSGRREARDAESPRAEETCSFKTPKRSSRSRVSAFSSPANEIDVHQEIFWDPHSPIAHKLGREQKKQTAGQSVIEISDIVNRIAPQEEKPSCYEGSLLGMWIGDDAIPCTPGIAIPRSRTKVNNTRGLQLKNKEEELMKLAKQFDKNLTEAIQDNGVPCFNSIYLTSEAKMSIECQGDAQMENLQEFVREHPQTDAALPLEVVKVTTETTECLEHSSQKSIDLEAEVALNTLFDCSTQKCSGALSQGSSNSGFHNSESALPMEECISEETVGIHGSVAMDAQQRQGPAATSDCRVLNQAEKTTVILQQTIQSAVIPEREMAVSNNLVTDDFDLLSDDSFVLQITQNLELISTPQKALPKAFHESCKTKERTTNSDRPDGVHGVFLKSSNISASHALQKESHTLGAAKSVPPWNNFHSKTHITGSVSKSSGSHSVPGTLKSKNVMEGYTQLKSSSIPGENPTSISGHCNLSKPLIGKSRIPVSSVHNESSASYVESKCNDQKDLAGQAVSKPLFQRGTPKKCVSLFGDQTEPRISDEVLSDSLWSVDCEDDDLLYRICDDVERNTQSQDIVKENVKTTLVLASTAKMEPDPGLMVPKQGLANCPQPLKNRASRKTFSLNASVTTTEILKKNSADPCIQRTCVPFKNESTNSIPEKVYRPNLGPDRSLVSGSGLVPMSDTCLSANNSTQWQNVTCNVGKVQNIGSNHTSREKSKYVFRKTSSSQALTLDHNGVTVGTLGRPPLALGENKNGPNIVLPTDVRMSPKSPFKRSFVHLEVEQKSRKCSQEEIARKKQQALERRKYKMQALFKNSAPA